jgi:hypothetical protein
MMPRVPRIMVALAVLNVNDSPFSTVTNLPDYRVA